MPRSALPAGTTAGQSKPQGSPSSRSRGYHFGAPSDNASGPSAAANCGGAGANSPMSELAKLMEEPAGGPNHGRRASDNPDTDGRSLPLGADEWQAAEFMRGGGWTIITSGGGERQRAGMTAHRGVVRSDEYVDADALRARVEQELGFTTEEVRSVYARESKGGPLPRDLRELRERLDARLLALSRSGANLRVLAQVLGLSVQPRTAEGKGGTCDAMDRALARAKTEETT